VFVLNQDKYLEGASVGGWLKLPASPYELQELFARIGIVGPIANPTVGTSSPTAGSSAGTVVDPTVVTSGTVVGPVAGYTAGSSAGTVVGPSENAYTLIVFRSAHDGVQELLSATDSLEELNTLASYIANMKPREFDKLSAILRSGAAGTIAGAAELNKLLCEDSFASYVLIDAKDEEELGRYRVKAQPEHAAPKGMSYAEYGRSCTSEYKGHFTEWGYIYNTANIAANISPKSQREPDSLPTKLQGEPDSLQPKLHGEHGEKPSTLKRIRESHTAPKLPITPIKREPNQEGKRQSDRRSKRKSRGDTEL